MAQKRLGRRGINVYHKITMVTKTFSTNSRTRAAATFERIVQATQRLLGSEEHQDLSMRAIAKEAGVSHGAIYKHFSSKTELIECVCEEALAEFEARLLRSLSRFPPGSFERVVAQGTEYIQFAIDRPEQFKTLLMPIKGRPRKLRDLPGMVGFELLRESIAEAMDSGQIRRDDPDLVAFFLWSRVHGIVMLLMACDFGDLLPVPPADRNPLRLFDLTRSVLWHGLKPPE